MAPAGRPGGGVAGSERSVGAAPKPPGRGRVAGSPAKAGGLVCCLIGPTMGGGAEGSTSRSGPRPSTRCACSRIWVCRPATPCRRQRTSVRSRDRDYALPTPRRVSFNEALQPQTIARGRCARVRYMANPQSMPRRFAYIALAMLCVAACKKTEPHGPDETDEGEACEPFTLSKGPERCLELEFDPSCWGGIYSAYTPGADPFYQIHNAENVAAGFYFNIELYTVYGPGWTGQTGTFAPDCENNGICIYFVHAGKEMYLATGGELTIDFLAEPTAGTTSGLPAGLTGSLSFDLQSPPVDECTLIDSANCSCIIAPNIEIVVVP